MTRLLHTDRQSAFLLERAHVRVDDERVVCDTVDETVERTFNVPHANLAFLLLGQGTSLTQPAARQLADEGVVVGFTGTGGAPLLMASYAIYRPTDRLHRWIAVQPRENARLAAAREIQGRRVTSLENIPERVSRVFETEAIADVLTKYRRSVGNAGDVDTLMGQEGRFCKDLYKHVAGEIFGIPRFRRDPGGHAGERQPDERARLLNEFIDQGNYLAYGLAAVGLWAHGIPAGLSALHGQSRAGGLVFDVADTFKDAFVLPVAGEVARKGPKDGREQEFRARLIDAFDEQRAMKHVFTNIDRMIEAGECA